MKREFSYTIYPKNSTKHFKQTCSTIAKIFPLAKKEDLLVDVDGSTVQIFFMGNNKEIAVYDDYDVGAVYVESDIDLAGAIEDYWSSKKKVRRIDEAAGEYADAPTLLAEA